MKYMREGEPELLSEEDASVMTEAREQYSQAVESSLATAQPGSPAVLGQSIRHAFHKVLFAVVLTPFPPPPPPNTWHQQLGRKTFEQTCSCHKLVRSPPQKQSNTDALSHSELLKSTSCMHNETISTGRLSIANTSIAIRRARALQQTHICFISSCKTGPSHQMFHSHRPASGELYRLLIQPKR